ncbi:MAG: amino acid ABC transporter permease [Burkholderiales bacterium]|nr:amino acid ABC transporter permease [Burkholderiales bacterium]
MTRYEFDWSIVTRPQFLDLIVDGVIRTIELTVFSGLLSFLLGALLAMARLWPAKGISAPANAITTAIRNIPALFWIMFFYFALPELMPSFLGAKLNEWPNYAFVAGVLGLSVDNGANLSDVLRNGMLNVSKGQRDAAASCGLSIVQECLLVLCPQTLRVMLPAITNRMIHNFKNTSLCVAIALPELTWATQQIESITFKGLEVTAVSTVIYSIGSFLIAFSLARLLKRRDIHKQEAAESDGVLDAT